MASRHALVTMHAATRVPADTDALSDLGSFGIRTYRRDMTGDLVAENRGVLRNTPLIVKDREIGMVRPAVFDSDFNVLGSEQSEINGFEHHRLFRRLRNPCPIIHRTSYFRSCFAEREEILVDLILVRRAQAVRRALVDRELGQFIRLHGKAVAKRGMPHANRSSIFTGSSRTRMPVAW